MDRSVIFAVAGSGKTTEIVRRLGEGRRALVLTYTEENLRNLRGKIETRFGHIPHHITAMTYFRFLYSFCFRPLAGLKWEVRGINFDDQPPRMFKDSDQRYYVDRRKRLFRGRIAKSVLKHYATPLLERIAAFFDLVCIDEAQDFGGHDFTLLMHLAKAPVDLLMVGDYRQHTYDTSRDGAANRTLHDDFAVYSRRFRDAGVHVDTISLSRSYRCSPAVCTFIEQHLQMPIGTYSTRSARIIDVETQAHADQLRHRDDIVKLFYERHVAYRCASQNWGASKGEDHYDDICVVLNPKTLAAYRKGTLATLAGQTLNKLYVALSRSRGDVYLAPQHFFEPKPSA